MDLTFSKMNELLKSAATFRKGLPEKIAFATLNCVDLILTLIAVDQGLREMNPLVNALLHSMPALLTVKLIFPVLIAWLIPSKMLLPAILFLSLVIMWDIKELIIFLM